MLNSNSCIEHICILGVEHPRSPGEQTSVVFVCSFLPFSVRTCRPHGLIVKNIVEVVKLMATGISACTNATTFFGQGLCDRLVFRTWVQNFPCSEKHDKLSVLEQNKPKC